MTLHDEKTSISARWFRIFALTGLCIASVPAWAQKQAPFGSQDYETINGLAPQGPVINPVQTPLQASCSNQANQLGLHGEERREFRERCKRRGL